MLKVSENPPISWPEDKFIHDFSGTWWLVHTKSRNEKALAWDMLRKGICYFLPMCWKVSKRKGRKLRSLMPLFTGYLFFCGSETNRLEALRTNRIANLIEVKNQQTLVSELTPIEQALKAGADLQPHTYIKVGAKCRVIAGPLIDTEGIAVKTHTGIRLVLQIDMLGQATSVEIDSDMIEVLE